MKLLAVNDSTQVICTVSTACAPACDSSIQFYTTDWKELPLADFITALPVMDDFLNAPDSASSYEYSEARLQADMLLTRKPICRQQIIRLLSHWPLLNIWKKKQRKN